MQNKKNKFYSGQRVYLYGAIEFSGTLRHIVDPYVQRWTVALDDGGYDSAMVKDITPLECRLEEKIESKPTYEELEQKIIALKKQIDRATEENNQLQKETELLKHNKNSSSQEILLKQENHRLIIKNKELKEECDQLKSENSELAEQLKKANCIIRRAKDISPLKRPTLARVERLAKPAFLEVKKCVGGWVLMLGDLARKFRRLRDIWELIVVDDWAISDLFPPDKITPLEKIKLPKWRNLPRTPDKFSIFSSKEPVEPLEKYIDPQDNAILYF